MYNSLIELKEEFVLYILCFDNISYEVIEKMDLERIKLIRLSDFESGKLLSVKKDRTVVEYMWTSTPHILKYVIDTYNVEMVTYLDADIFFFKKPSILIDEFLDSQNSILITEHRYTPSRDQSETTGVYCVQFVTFKNDEHGLIALDWWKDRCIEWCYARVEDGKFGDQKYLDDWTTRFEKVHVLEHLGGGVAPWNIQQYDIYNTDNTVTGIDKRTKSEFEVVFYHFHRLKFYKNKKVELIFSYPLTSNIKNFIYKPYIRILEEIKSQISSIDDTFDPHGSIIQFKDWKLPLRNLRRRFRGTYNLINLDNWK